MKVLVLPSRLRATLAIMMLAVPIAAVEVAISERALWWRLPYRSMAMGAGMALACSVPCWFAVLNGKKWGLYYFSLASVFWIVFTALASVHRGNPALGFFSLFLLSYSTGLLSLFWNEMGRSFFDPRIKWYQSLPRPIPGLECEIQLPATQTEPDQTQNKLKVSRLDYDGAFVFSDRETRELQSEVLKDAGQVALAFKFRNENVSCEAVPVCVLNRGPGAGLRFRTLSPDQRKVLGDFIEVLRGEGYVS